MGSPYQYFPYSLTGLDPFGRAEDRLVKPCQDIALQNAQQAFVNAHLLAAGVKSVPEIQWVPPPKRCEYCRTHLTAHQPRCMSCGAPT